MFCKKNFTAKTTTTKYCSHSCNNRHYKQCVRDKKIALASPPITKSVESSREYLSMAETASLLGVHVRTIMNMIKQKKLHYGKVGRRIVIQRDAIDEMLSHTHNSEQKAKNSAM